MTVNTRIEENGSLPDQTRLEVSAAPTLNVDAERNNGARLIVVPDDAKTEIRPPEIEPRNTRAKIAAGVIAAVLAATGAVAGLRMRNTGGDRRPPVAITAPGRVHQTDAAVESGDGVTQSSDAATDSEARRRRRGRRGSSTDPHTENFGAYVPRDTGVLNAPQPATPNQVPTTPAPQQTPAPDAGTNALQELLDQIGD
jgi:hypothetical protein